MNIVQEVPLRAQFEHDKSTPEERKLYITLAYIALETGVFVKYFAEGCEDVAYLRSAQEFGGISQRGFKRFTYLKSEVIDVENCDYIAENAVEVFV